VRLIPRDRLVEKKNYDEKGNVMYFESDKNNRQKSLRSFLADKALLSKQECLQSRSWPSGFCRPSDSHIRTWSEVSCVMSLYYEAADLLITPINAGGSLKSRIFSKKDLKSQPAQIYALAIEACKWSSVLKEVIEHAEILRLERKVSY
jgi:hypothetical protein